MRDKLRLPNLLESQTATTIRAISIMARFTFASKRFGVLSPLWTSKPSTPRKRMSAFKRRHVSSAIGLTSEKEFFRRVPRQIHLQSRTGQLRRNIHCVGDDRQISIIAERPGDGGGGCSRITTCPSSTIFAAAVAILIFTLRCSFSFTRRV